MIAIAVSRDLCGDHLNYLSSKGDRYYRKSLFMGRSLLINDQLQDLESVCHLPYRQCDRLGEFANPKLAAMYKQLVHRGQTSSIEALKVGALIEETDIKDLRDRLNATNHPQLKTLYSNLLQGSYNHLQAFMRQIERQGEDYTPQVLSQQEFTTILSQGQRSGRR